MQKEKNRMKESMRSVLKKNDIESRNRARTIGSDLSDRQRLKQNMLIRTQNQLREGRFFHGILTYLSRPLERIYFILDSKRGLLFTFTTIG